VTAIKRDPRRIGIEVVEQGVGAGIASRVVTASAPHAAVECVQMTRGESVKMSARERWRRSGQVTTRANTTAPHTIKPKDPIVAPTMSGLVETENATAYGYPMVQAVRSSHARNSHMIHRAVFDVSMMILPVLWMLAL
jgi:hypothetical protein